MMKRLALLLCLALATPAPAQEQAELIPPDIGVRVAARYALPRLAAFADAGAGLGAAMGDLCAAPGAEALEDARTAFAGAVRAWGPVSILRFGPLVAENRFERFFFWPDARGVTLRQVQGLLAEKDETAATAAGLADKSVALQGLPALEFVLFGDGSEALAQGSEPYRCRYGAAIADSAAERARELAWAWAPGAPFHAEFTQPAAGNALYRSPREVAGEVVKALSTGLQFVHDAELLPALGESAERANGRRAPFWRSNLTFDFVGAQAEGLIGLLRATGFEARLDAEGRAILDSVLFDLEHALEAIEAVEAPAQTAFAAAEPRGRIAYAAVALEGAKRQIGARLSAAIGLTMGFNALDGD